MQLQDGYSKIASTSKEEKIVKALQSVLETYGENEGLVAVLQSREGVGNRRFNEFCMQIVPIIRSKVSTVPRYKALSQFHQLRMKQLPDLWKALYTDLHLPPAKAVSIQSVNRQLLNLILLEGESSTAKAHSTESVSMSSEEENAVRCASGYIALKLMKLFEKKGDDEAAEFVDCLSGMAVTGEVSSFFAYTQEWVKAVDRGGLFQINDLGFLLFHSIELKTQACLPQHLQCPSGGSSIETIVMDDQNVQFCLSMVSAQITDKEHSSELLKIVVQQWVTIRGFAITSTWIEDFKLANKKTTRGSKALHKRLKDASDTSSAKTEG